MSAARFQNPWTMVPGWLSTRSDLDKDQLIIASSILSMYHYKQKPIKFTKEYLWEKISKDPFTADSMIVVENIIESLVDKGIIYLLDNGMMQAGRAAMTAEEGSFPSSGWEAIRLSESVDSLISGLDR